MRVALTEIDQGRAEWLEVVPLAPSILAAQAPKRRSGAEETVAAQIRGVR